MSRQRESHRLLKFYQRAQAALGKEAYERTLRRWDDMRPDTLLTSPDRWVVDWHRETDELRRKSRRLGQSYYRLERAIWLDATVDDGTAFGQDTTLAKLWEEFNTSAGRRVSKTTQSVKPVKVDPSPWKEYDAAHSWRTTASSFYVKGAQRMKREERKQRAGGRSVLDSIDDLEATLESIGKQIAGEAQRITEDGGREAISEAVDHDRKALAYMRVPNPGACYFCLMLASRGAVYKSKHSAGDHEVRKFHPNCQCAAVPIFTRSYEYPAAVKHAVEFWKNNWNGDMRDFRKAVEQSKKRR
ncbi:hypothetical protein ABZV77_11540 [Streptomyces sp. NPDC004732]|uniref:VG15 protein n=1 Tax=Streptomyces sp. NPDC004732 TaxID=3154290 RepID=UPI0033BE89EC